MNSISMLLALCLGGWFPAFDCDATPSPSPSPAVKRGQYIEGEMLVRFKSGVTKQQIEELNRSHGVRVLGLIEGIGVYKLGLPPGTTVPEMIERYRTSPLVEYAEPNHRVQIMGETR